MGAGEGEGEVEGAEGGCGGGRVGDGGVSDGGGHGWRKVSGFYARWARLAGDWGFVEVGGAGWCGSGLLVCEYEGVEVCIVDQLRSCWCQYDCRGSWRFYDL